MISCAVIFDMDGVLINSMKYVFDSLNIIVGEHGYKIDPKDYTLYMGINSKRLNELFEKHFNLDFGADYLKTKTTEIQIELMEEEEKPSPALISLLEELKQNNIPFGIGTSSPKHRTDEILKAVGLDKYFDVIVNGDEIDNHKPHPETFLKVANKLNMAPENCIVFEDAKNGVYAAKAGNMKVIAIRTDFQNDEDLKDADMLVDGFEDIALEKIYNLF